MAQAIMDPDEVRRFATELKRFMEVSEKHTPFLLRKAQRIEEYLDQR